MYKEVTKSRGPWPPGSDTHGSGHALPCRRITRPPSPENELEIRYCEDSGSQCMHVMFTNILPLAIYSLTNEGFSLLRFYSIHAWD